jgi:hypothetical protein
MNLNQKEEEEKNTTRVVQMATDRSSATSTVMGHTTLSRLVGRP